MQTIKLSLTATTKYIERRQQKRRKITKPETKQVKLEDRSNSSENKESGSGSRTNIGINNGKQQ